MEIEAIASVCRRGLDETLQTVHKLTTGSESASEALLCSMNDVLSEVVNTNFASSESHASLARLYRVLEQAHAALLGECDSLPLLFFARSFAVVIEEAVRQLGDDDEDEEEVVEVEDTATVRDESTVPLAIEDERVVDDVIEVVEETSDVNDLVATDAVEQQMFRHAAEASKVPVADGVETIVVDGGARRVDDVIVETRREDDAESVRSWSTGGTPNEESLQWEEEYLVSRTAAGRESAASDAYTSTGSGWTEATPASASLSETSTTMTTSGKMAAGAAGAKKEHDAPAQESSQMQQVQPSPPSRDYAAEATKGRITIYNIPTCARKHDVQAFLRPIGPIRSLCLPSRQYDDEALGYALAKFETNEEADDAVARLNGVQLCGAPVAVRRAAFSVTYPDAAEFRPASADRPPIRDPADAIEEEPSRKDRFARDYEIAEQEEEESPRFGCGEKVAVRDHTDAVNEKSPRFGCDQEAFIRDRAYEPPRSPGYNPNAPEFRPSACLAFIRDSAEASPNFGCYREPAAATWDDDGVWGSPMQERAFDLPPVRYHADYDEAPPRFGCYQEARQERTWDADGVWPEKW